MNLTIEEIATRIWNEGAHAMGLEYMRSAVLNAEDEQSRQSAQSMCELFEQTIRDEIEELERDARCKLARLRSVLED